VALPGHAMERRKRFYIKAQAAPVEGGFAVQLDGRTAHSSEGRPLVAPTLALAEQVAAEWASQGEEIDQATMPATALIGGALAMAREDVRAATVSRVASFAASDLLCYFAKGPPPLVERQERRWGPVIDWAERSLAVEFNRIHGVVHQPQPEATLQRIEALAADENAFTLAALGAAAALFGSAILAFALRAGQLTAAAAFDLSRLDETFQEERWGVDAEAAARVAAMAREAAMLGRWFAALH
jgi:chaperone required for assembly of F1-ATPase